MMEVQKYLAEHTLEELTEEFGIMVTDYPDRVVLNYNQIDSPRFNPICDECRALILHKGTWVVMSRAFDRFYNVGEGNNQEWEDINFNHEGRFEEKRDGSLLSVYWDGHQWCVATRKMAFAEGTMACGITFRQLFDKAASKTKLMEWLNNKDQSFGTPGCPNWGHTFIFEITAPENRVVTPYSATKLTLIGVRHNKTGNELDVHGLNMVSNYIGVDRPVQYPFWSMDEAVEGANKLEIMEEGFVIIVCKKEGSHYRVKCKNPKFVAIAHMRDNGNVSPKRIMTLVIANEQHEYLRYFPEDKHYFDFCEEVYNESLERIREIIKEHMHIEDQKEFALTIMPLVKLSYEKGVIFGARKGKSIEDKILEMGGKKIAQGLGLKEKFVKKFGIEEEEEGEI